MLSHCSLDKHEWLFVYVCQLAHLTGSDQEVKCVSIALCHVRVKSLRAKSNGHFSHTHRPKPFPLLTETQPEAKQTETTWGQTIQYFTTSVFKSWEQNPKFTEDAKSKWAGGIKRYYMLWYNNKDTILHLLWAWI